MQSKNEFIPKKLQKQAFFISRKTILELIKLAGLSHALLSFIHRNSEDLIQSGATVAIKQIREQDLDSKFFFTLPDTAMAIIQAWLGENCRPVLETYLAQNKEEQTSKLCEYLASLRLYMLKGIPAPAGIVERAQCFLACVSDQQWHPVINVVMTLSYRQDENSQPFKPADYYRLICEMLERPEAIELEENLKLQLLVVGFCVALVQRNRKLATDLLAKIQISDYEQRPKDRMGDRLQKKFNNVFTNTASRPEVVTTATDDMFKDTKGLEVLAVCTKAPYGNNAEHQRFAFSKVLAVRGKDEKWYNLNDREKNRLFPETGSIVHFAGKNYPPLPKFQSHGVWRVEEQSLSPEQRTKFDTRFYAAKKILPVHPVLTLEHISSCDKAMAREWIEHTSILDSDVGGETVLRFTDGLFVHTTGSYVNLRNEGFTQPLRAWEDLPIVQLSPVVQLHIGDLPINEQTYDLVRPSKGIVSAMRQLPSVTSRESSKFAEAIAELGSNQSLDTRIQNLDMTELDFDSSDIEQLVTLLFETEAVAKEIDDKSEQYLAATRNLLNEATQEHKHYKQLADTVDNIHAQQRQILGNAQDSLNKLFDTRQSELQEQSREIYELQAILQDKIDQKKHDDLHKLEQRIDALEKFIASKLIS